MFIGMKYTSNSIGVVPKSAERRYVYICIVCVLEVYLLVGSAYFLQIKCLFDGKKYTSIDLTIDKCQPFFIFYGQQYRFAISHIYLFVIIQGFCLSVA